MPTPIHRRSYDCEVLLADDGRLLARGRLTDVRPQGLGRADGEPLTIHDMTIEVVVNREGMVIEEASATMHTNPYRQCRGILVDYRQLVGVSVARGYARTVRELFGGPRGCSHLGALLQALGPVCVQAGWSARGFDDDPAVRVANDDDPADRALRARLNADSCHVWAVGGPQVVALERGESAMRPGWESARLRSLGIDVVDDEA